MTAAGPETRRREQSQQPAVLGRAGRCRASSGWPCCSSCRSTRCWPSPMGKLNQIFESPVAVWNPLQWSSSNFIDGLARPGRGSARSPARSSSGRSSTWPSPRLLSPAHRLPGRLLRGPVRRPPQGPVPGAADRAVLDQLHDAHAGLDRPAADQRLREQGPRPGGHLGPVNWLGGKLGHGGARPGLRLHPVPDPGAVRGPGPDRPRADRGRP